MIRFTHLSQYESSYDQYFGRLLKETCELYLYLDQEVSRKLLPAVGSVLAKYLGITQFNTYAHHRENYIKEVGSQAYKNYRAPRDWQMNSSFHIPSDDRFFADPILASQQFKQIRAGKPSPQIDVPKESNENKHLSSPN